MAGTTDTKKVISVEAIGLFADTDQYSFTQAARKSAPNLVSDLNENLTKLTSECVSTH